MYLRIKSCFFSCSIFSDHVALGTKIKTNVLKSFKVSNSFQLYFLLSIKTYFGTPCICIIIMTITLIAQYLHNLVH